MITNGRLRVIFGATIFVLFLNYLFSISFNDDSYFSGNAIQEPNEVDFEDEPLETSKILGEGGGESFLSEALVPSDDADIDLEDYEDVQRRVRNYPYEHQSLLTNRSGCISFPDVSHLKHFNNIWQIYAGEDDLAHLFGAYFDDRGEKPVVRIFSVMNTASPSEKIFCRMWFEDEAEVQTTDTMDYEVMNDLQLDEGVVQMITCQLPKGMKTAPLSISLGHSRCERPTNNLRVLNERPKGEKGDVFVCVKDLDLLSDDRAVEIVEFIETNKLFGVSHFEFYSRRMADEIDSVLTHYQEEGSLRLTDLSDTSKGEDENDEEQRRLLDRVLYHDCFYRNMYKFRYALLLDLNEIFVPKAASTYIDMLKGVKNGVKKEVASFGARNKIFVSDPRAPNKTHEGIPGDYRFLQTTNVALNADPIVGKRRRSFFDTAKVLTLSSDQPLSCLQKCKKLEIPDKIGQLNHYQSSCEESAEKCDARLGNPEEIEEDLALWRFKEDLLKRMDEVFEALGTASE